MSKLNSVSRLEENYIWITEETSLEDCRELQSEAYKQFALFVVQKISILKPQRSVIQNEKTLNGSLMQTQVEEKRIVLVERWCVFLHKQGPKVLVINTVLQTCACLYAVWSMSNLQRPSIIIPQPIVAQQYPNHQLGTKQFFTDSYPASKNEMDNCYSGYEPDWDSENWGEEQDDKTSTCEWKFQNEHSDSSSNSHLTNESVNSSSNSHLTNEIVNSTSNSFLDNSKTKRKIKVNVGGSVTLPPLQREWRFPHLLPVVFQINNPVPLGVNPNPNADYRRMRTSAWFTKYYIYMEAWKHMWHFYNQDIKSNFYCDLFFNKPLQLENVEKNSNPSTLRLFVNPESYLVGANYSTFRPTFGRLKGSLLSNVKVTHDFRYKKHVAFELGSVYKLRYPDSTFDTSLAFYLSPYSSNDKFKVFIGFTYNRELVNQMKEQKDSPKDLPKDLPKGLPKMRGGSTESFPLSVRSAYSNASNTSMNAPAFCQDFGLAFEVAGYEVTGDDIQEFVTEYQPYLVHLLDPHFLKDRQALFDAWMRMKHGKLLINYDETHIASLTLFNERFTDRINVRNYLSQFVPKYFDHFWSKHNINYVAIKTFHENYSGISGLFSKKYEAQRANILNTFLQSRTFPIGSEDQKQSQKKLDRLQRDYEFQYKVDQIKNELKAHGFPKVPFMVNKELVSSEEIKTFLLFDCEELVNNGRLNVEHYTAAEKECFASFFRSAILIDRNQAKWDDKVWHGLIRYQIAQNQPLSSVAKMSIIDAIELFRKVCVGSYARLSDGERQELSNTVQQSKILLAETSTIVVKTAVAEAAVVAVEKLAIKTLKNPTTACLIGVVALASQGLSVAIMATSMMFGVNLVTRLTTNQNQPPNPDAN